MSIGGGVLNPGKLSSPKEMEFSIQGNWSIGGGVLNLGKLFSP